MRIMRFCKPGTAASSTSTPKSLRATMMASDASMMAAKLSMASARSILAMMLAWPPACLTRLLANSTSAAVLGKDMAISIGHRRVNYLQPEQKRSREKRAAATTCCQRPAGSSDQVRELADGRRSECPSASASVWPCLTCRRDARQHAASKCCQRQAGSSDPVRELADGGRSECPRARSSVGPCLFCRRDARQHFGVQRGFASRASNCRFASA